MVERARPANARAADSLAREVAHLLERLTREHARLLALCERRKHALARADVRGIRAAVIEESEVVQAIASMEREREALVERAAARFGIERDADRPLTLTAIAATFEEPERARLTGLAAGLRSLIERIRKENAAVREAADSLASHMRGLIQTVEHKLSTSGAYGPSGAVGVGPAVMTAMDVTT